MKIALKISNDMTLSGVNLQIDNNWSKKILEWKYIFNVLYLTTGNSTIKKHRKKSFTKTPMT